MVRKVSTLLCVLALIFGFAVTAQAATHTVYEGTPSNTYITYFRDIVAGLSLKDHYVAFRSGQYEYTMVTGQLSYDGQTFTLHENGHIYTIETDSGYNGNYRYTVEEIGTFSLNANESIIYTDLGQFPQLEERGAKYEILTAVLVAVGLLGGVIGGIFRHR